MSTIQQIEHTDGQVWSLEEVEGEYFMMHVIDGDEAGPRMVMPIDPVVLWSFARAARSHSSPIPDRNQNVIQFPTMTIRQDRRSA